MKKVTGALRGGVAAVQLRDKGRDAVDSIPFARSVRRVCRERRVPFLVNDRIEVALAVDADGLHVGRADIPPALARAMLGDSKIVGVSASSIDGVRKAERSGADYAGIGPVFATPFKKGATPVRRHDLAKAAGLAFPVFAIGGIDVRGARALASFGMKRAAVIRSVLGSRSPRRSAARLIGILKGGHDTT